MFQHVTLWSLNHMLKTGKVWAQRTGWRCIIFNLICRPMELQMKLMFHTDSLHFVRRRCCWRQVFHPWTATPHQVSSHQTCCSYHHIWWFQSPSLVDLLGNKHPLLESIKSDKIGMFEEGGNYLTSFQMLDVTPKQSRKKSMFLLVSWKIYGWNHGHSSSRPPQ